MERYDYRKALKNDILDYIADHGITLSDYDGDMDAMRDDLNDRLFVEDSVTGNASGSYTFSSWAAEENICHNLDLLGEALHEFGFDTSRQLTQGAEACDVIIRCYLLGEVLEEVLEEMDC